MCESCECAVLSITGLHRVVLFITGGSSGEFCGRCQETESSCSLWADPPQIIHIDGDEEHVEGFSTEKSSFGSQLCLQRTACRYWSLTKIPGDGRRRQYWEAKCKAVAESASGLGVRCRVATIRRPSTPAKSSQQPRRARSCEFLGEAGSSDALQSRGTADTSVDCSSNGQLVQISRAALAAAQLSLEELLPADLSAKHCDAAVQEAVVASANTEPAAATVQQSCEFFGEALAFRLSRWIAKTFTLSVAIIRMIIIFFINIQYALADVQLHAVFVHF